MRNVGMGRKWLAFAAALCVGLAAGAGAVKAEECFIISVDGLDMSMLNSDDYVSRHLSADTPGLRVQKYISDSGELAAPVRLTLVQMDTQTLIYDKNYGYQSGTFDSGIIYLPYAGSYTVPYLVTLTIADWVYAVPFMRLEPRLEHNRACTYGARMRDFNPLLTDDWLMGTMVDLNELRPRGSINVPVYASNAYAVGEATLSLGGDNLTATLAFYASAEVELHNYRLFCVRDVGSLTTADPYGLTERSYGVGEPIPVAGADTVLIYLPMSLSYNSAGLPARGYDINSPYTRRQLALWEKNLLRDPGEGFPDATPIPEHADEENAGEWFPGEEEEPPPPDSPPDGEGDEQDTMHDGQ